MRSLAALLLLTACSAEPEPPRGFTADDQRQLNEATDMLDANSVSLDAVSNESTAP